ncbi:MAG: cadherin-like domain-containing protein [Verrucomicrobia bacterium]|nr:cadherin-like domain-containing protein [Verrucomicrobiota bacterium]
MNSSDLSQSGVFGTGNLPPVAFDDFAGTTTNTPIAIAVLANDNDPDASLATNSVAIVTNPANGTVSVNSTSGIITYTPANGFEGTNTFTYTVQDNQGAVSIPGTVTVVVIQPVITSNTAPIAANDSASTTNGIPVAVDILANDTGTVGTIDPSTVSVTASPAHGAATVDATTGAVTYTASTGFSGNDTFTYTVQDDLGSTSNPATVTVAVNAPVVPPAPAPMRFYVYQQTTALKDHRYPRVNNLGDYVYQEQVNGLWQVFEGGVSGQIRQITFPDAVYSDATSPALADDGSFICSQTRTNAQGSFKDTVFYPGPGGPQNVLCASSLVANVFRFETFNCGVEPSLASNGKIIRSSQYDLSTLSGNDSHVGNLYVAGNLVASGMSSPWQHPDVNQAGDFVFSSGGQVFLNNQFAVNAAAGSLNDVPTDNPDIAYVNGSTLTSTVLGTLQDQNGSPLTGSWVDINRSGVIVFEKQVGGFYQVFKAYPLYPRIITVGGTTAQVGLPYQYSSDNFAQAYGGNPEPNDPRVISDITWDLVPNPNNPAGFSIHATTGKINWIPTAPGTFTATIRATYYFLDDFTTQEDTQTLTITVTQGAFEVVDAVDFRAANLPDLLTTPDSYYSGGTASVGVVADGVSELVVRVPLAGVDLTDPTLNLHFAIAGANAANDGFLFGIGSTNGAANVAATLSASGAAHKAVCVYQAPLDYSAASQPVTLNLLNGATVVATQTIQLRRPPVVLVHDQWSGPDEWSALLSPLIDAGVDVSLVDYSSTAGTNFNANASRLFENTTATVNLARQSGFAASQVDLIGHGAGGLLARIYAERYSQQVSNYDKGDVHKLITLGTPHQGSYLAGLVTTLQTNNPTGYATLRSAITTASQAAGTFPAVDLSEGVLTDETPGSAALGALSASTPPSHALVTTATTLPPGEVFDVIHFALGAAIQGDGLASTTSAQGGVANGAFTQLAGVPHSGQASDTNVMTAILDLLTQPIATSGKFGHFTANSNLAPPTPPTINTGSWLVLSGLTGGQTVTPGQNVSVTAAASDARALQSVSFVTPGAATSDTTAPYTFSFQVPDTMVGTIKLLAAGKDLSGQVSFASLSLNIVPAATLLAISVDTTNVTLTSKAPFRLHVFGDYSDSVRRDLTAYSAGTRYTTSDRFTVRVDTNGVLRAVQATTTPIVITITNGALQTQANVTVQFFNFPPTPIITSDKTSGPAPLDVQFDGTTSFDPEGQPLTFAWEFPDGTTSNLATPPAHRFWAPGNHVVTLTVTDAQGLIAIGHLIVNVQPRFVMIDPVLTVTQRLAFNAVIVTNGGSLKATAGWDCGDLLVVGSSLQLGTNSTAANATISNSILIGTNGFSMTGQVQLTVTNYLVGTGSLGSLTASGTNVFNGTFGAASFLLTAGSVLTTVPLVPLVLNVAGQAQVAAGGLIDGRAKGYQGTISNGTGPGAGLQSSVGGGYGGQGGKPGANSLGGQSYGLFDVPSSFGSSGYGSNGDQSLGGHGGGLVQVAATQLLLDGVIRVDGQSVGGPAQPNDSGGSGGSVWLQVGSLSGSGTISADGGSHNGLSNPTNSFVSGGGGGAGRVAINYTSMSAFNGMISAKGGLGHDNAGLVDPLRCGGAGTVYLKKSSDTYGELIIDNAGNATSGFTTPLPPQWLVRLETFSVLGNARVSTPDSVHVVNGNASSFSALITGGQLQVSGLIVAGTLVFGPADSDDDGLPDTYEIANGLNPNDPTDASHDDDDDGFTNWQEYLAGTDPHNPASAMTMTQTAAFGQDAHLSFNTLVGKKYRVEYSDTSPSANANWSILADDILGTGSVLNAIDVGSSNRLTRFYRISLKP